MDIIRLTEPNTPLNDADHVGSFNLREEAMKLLFEKYESVDIDTMGFPKNWKELLEREKTY